MDQEIDTERTQDRQVQQRQEYHRLRREYMEDWAPPGPIVGFQLHEVDGKELILMEWKNYNHW